MSLNTFVYPNGIGRSLGDSLVTIAPLYTSKVVYFVHSDGDASNSGLVPGAPLPTLQDAVSAAPAPGIIVMLDGHTETITSVISVISNIIIVGAGQSDGKPTVKLTNNQASDHLLDFTGANVEIRNVWFPAEAQANSAPRVAASADGFRMTGCYCECDENSNSYALALESGWGNARIENTTFVSTATDQTDPPATAINVVAGDHLGLDGLTLDGGTVGWQQVESVGNPALDLAGSVTDVRGENITLLRSSDIGFQTGSTGHLSVGTASYDSMVYAYSPGG